jgi:hypothetical protein
MKKFSILTLLLIAMVSTAMAQPGFEDDVDDVPLDGGISILAGAAIAYGLKRSSKIFEANESSFKK